MKKFMMIAAVAMMSLVANAQNPDAVKQVLKSTDYKEANEIVKQSQDQMTNEEKAKVQNKLCALALEKVAKEEKKYAEWQAQILKDYDPMKYWKNCYSALKHARECDKADREPNDKGQVKPKFRKANAQKVNPCRQALIQGGLECYNSKDYEQAARFFGAFVESRQEPLYEGFDFSAETNYSQITYYAGLAAFFNKDFKKANKYADFALASGDKEIEGDCVTLKLGALEEQAKAGEIDTTQYLSKVKKFYTQFPNNEGIFSRLYTIYEDSGDKEGAQKLLSKRLKENPNDILALAFMGQAAQNAANYESAIDSYKRAVGAKPDFLAAKYNLGICYLNLAAQISEKNSDARGNLKPEFKQAVLDNLNNAKTSLEEVAAADPNEEQVRWKYTLDRVNYSLENVK